MNGYTSLSIAEKMKGHTGFNGKHEPSLPLSYMGLMTNSWEIIGNYMYTVHAYRPLIYLVPTGLLDVDVIRPRTFPLSALSEAMKAASTTGNLECDGVLS
jgi:threonine dehydrogenase-like Zn-dependent dehydrogenase